MIFKWKNETLLITGASSGLGLALSKKAGELKASVIMIAKNLENLEKAQKEVINRGGKAYIYPFDLHDVDLIGDLYKKIIKEIDKVPSILINNAGYNAAGFVQNTPLDVYERNYKVNVLAPIALMQCAIPDMLTNKKGVIVNIMGAANYHSFPGASSYGSTKVALGAIHESLQTEVSGLPIRTLKVNPGGFRSNYGKNRLIEGRFKDYKFPEHTGGKDPAIVASEIFKAVEQGKKELNLSSGMDRIGYHLNYWAPRLVDKLLVMRNQLLLSKRPDFT